MSKKYSLEVVPATWTSRAKYIIKEGRKEILELSVEKEANAVLDYLNSISKSKRKPTKKTTPTADKDAGTVKKSVKE